MMGTIRVLGIKGDTETTWDPTNPEETAEAKNLFDSMIGGQHYAAFQVETPGEPGTQTRTFDPEAEEILMVGAMQGG